MTAGGLNAHGRRAAGLSAVRRIARARRSLVAAAVARALLLAVLAALLVLATGLVVDTFVGLPLEARRWLVPLALAVGAAALARTALGPVRAAVRATDESVALWFETRLPALRYALVTSVDARYAGTVPALERIADEAPLEREIASASRTALMRPALAVGAIALGLLLMPPMAMGRITAPTAGDALGRMRTDARAAADPLATIVAHVTPPAYAGMDAVAYDEPSTIAALVGSRVRIEGRGTGVRAVVGGTTGSGASSAGATDITRADTLDAREADGAWSVTLPFPPVARAVRLLGPARDRVLVLDPIADTVPLVQLELPVRDSVLRAAQGRVPLRATVRDDHGLARAAFEYIVSTGAGETFTFRNGTVGEQRFGRGARTATLEGVLVLDTLGLKGGDLIHVRAVGADRNDVTGPGLGVSETRTLRIARADEYDSVSVDPMPPTEPEKNAMSQRMILQMTEELVARQPRISEATLTDESRRIAREQVRLRKRVGEVVFQRLGEDGGEHSHFAGDGHEHGTEGPLNPDQILAAAEAASNAGATRMLESEGDESPIVAINRPLLEAYNHMWRAATELETARPHQAIPWMERAIEALQRARAAERIYLRGRPPRVVVDVAKVRGTGKDTGSSSEREARAPADPARAERLARFDVALGIVQRDASAAADSLLLLRLTVPEDDAAAARALDAAASQLRSGGDVTEALARARRALAGAPVRRSTLGPWGR